MARGFRFTPTGVGTISVRLVLGDGWTVHPHGRGDNMTAILQAATSIGSPPRAWGQYVLERGDDAVARFTPTGVGTMNGLMAQARANAVHPHGRGDNVVLCRCVAFWPGSPPRAWGQ